MKKNKQIKTWELNEKYGYVVVGIFIVMFIIFLYMVINIIRANSKQYTYFIGEEKGISKECYQTEDQDCMCLIGDNYIWVDSYHD